MKRQCVLLWFWAFAAVVMSQNPICPEGTFFSDPQARVWDRHVYLYGSRDERAGQWCSHDNDVLSSDLSMIQWKLHRDVLSSRGPNDEIAGTDALLFASDCFRLDSLYHLVYCTPDRNHAEGIAVSSSPTGPFYRGKQIVGPTEIDPSVFIDDDGSVWLFWGQYSLKAARLKPDLSGIDSTTYHEGILTRQEHFFHEGVQAFKRGDTYYLCFADESRAQRPTCLGYATAKSLLGPYTYQGVIIDNDGCDPQNWNNHGSVVQVGNDWYVFYHRATNGTSVFRKACVEPITFDSQGLIPEVLPTTNGVAPLLNPAEATEARRACHLTGQLRVTTLPDGQERLTHISDGDEAVFRYYRFPRRRLKHAMLSLQVSSPMQVEVSVGEVRVASAKVEPTDTMQTVVLPLEVRPPRGRQTVRIRFHGNPMSAQMEAFKFK